MLRYIVPTVLLSVSLGLPAAAMPAAGPAPQAEGAELIPAQLVIRSDRDRHHDRHDYRPGHRYKSAPRGWHRYHARPRDWQRRRCIMVGPLWYCP